MIPRQTRPEFPQMQESRPIEQPQSDPNIGTMERMPRIFSGGGPKREEMNPRPSIMGRGNMPMMPNNNQMTQPNTGMGQMNNNMGGPTPEMLMQLIQSLQRFRLFGGNNMGGMR